MAEISTGKSDRKGLKINQIICWLNLRSRISSTTAWWTRLVLLLASQIWSTALLGFATAFSTQESKEALEFFKKYGIVVFKDVLSKEEQNGKKKFWIWIK